MMRYLLAALLLCLFSFQAQARHSHHHTSRHFTHHRVHHDGLSRHRYVYRGSHHRRTRLASLGDGGGRGGRPHAWCGWYARRLVRSDPGVAYNLARNWTHWGRPSGPGVGVMVVWSHHVGMITGRAANGQWIVKSGNDGHAVRERPRSIAGAIAFRAG